MMGEAYFHHSAFMHRLRKRGKKPAGMKLNSIGPMSGLERKEDKK
jgi:hypothetical protein